MSQKKEIMPPKREEIAVSPGGGNQEEEQGELTSLVEKKIKLPKPEDAKEGKNIILLSDGTGNSSGKLARTNVWRLYQALDLSTAPGQKQQIAYYDDGVGTSSFKPLALLGGITGWGLKRNVLDLYTFLCRHYEPGDQIYCFGFSRGAFTIRVLAGLIVNQGLVKADTQGELKHLAKQAFRAYRKARYNKPITKLFRLLRDGFLRAKYKITGATIYDPKAAKLKAETEKRMPSIAFLGLWDTVAAYGLPFDELTHAWNFIFPLAFPDRNLSDKVEYACHALALDDERLSFHPELWNENKADYKKSPYTRSPDGRLEQVWFAGMHSNLGGGYPDDGMAHVPLNWIMDKAEEKVDAAGNLSGLRFIRAERDRLKAAADVNGKMYDSRRGLGGAYRYAPRKLKDLLHEENQASTTQAKIHESVFTRIKNRVDGYAPIGLPESYQIYPPPQTNGLPVPVEPVPADPNPHKRAELQENVWNLVWWKRLVYFLTVVTFIWLLTLPLYSSDTYGWEQGLSFLRPIFGSLSALLPDFLGTWLEAFKRHPGLFSCIVILLLFWLHRGSVLQRKIFDKMCLIFDEKAEDKKARGFAHALRTKGKKPAKFIKRKVIPALILVIALWLIILSVVRVSNIVKDSLGLFSTPTPVGKLNMELKDGEVVIHNHQFSALT